MSLLPEIKLRSQMFDIVFEAVKDIHTSPQNDITKFPAYSCSNYAILWNLRHSSKFSLSEDMYINIAMEIDSLNKQAAVLMEKKFRTTPELYSVFQVQYLQTYDDKPPEWKVGNRFFKGNLCDVNLKDDDRFRKVEGKRNLACFLGVAYLTFPVHYPIQYLVSSEDRIQATAIGNSGLTFPYLSGTTGINHRRGPGPKSKKVKAAKSKSDDDDLINDHENKKAAYIKANFGFAQSGAVIRMGNRRKKVYKQSGYKCLACGETDLGKLTIDHVVARSVGGSNKLQNLQTLCYNCNTSKGDKTIDYRK